MAISSSWLGSQKITVQSSKVPGTLTDYPAYVSRSQLQDSIVDPSGEDSSQADGGDVRFSSDADGLIELAFDLVSWGHDSSSGAGDAAIEVHVKIPSVSGSVDTDIYIWFKTLGTTIGYPVTNSYGAYNTWDSNFVGVWHMQEDPSGLGGVILDSTGNDHNGVPGGSMTLSDSIQGKLGGNSIDFDGVDDSIKVPDHVDLDGMAAMTLEAWSYMNAYGTFPNIVGKGSYIPILYAMYSGNLNGQTRFGIASPTYETPNTGTAAIGSWVKTDAIVSSTDVDFYFNNVTVGAQARTEGVPSDNNTLVFGGTSDDHVDGFLDGRIDEIRISNIARSTDYIAATYNNQSSPSTFWAISAVVITLPTSAAMAISKIERLNTISEIERLHINTRIETLNIKT